jgi:drug/metabolite transporter superfamily protein YnfA
VESVALAAGGVVFVAFALVWVMEVAGWRHR